FNNFSIETAYFYIKGDASDLWLGDIKNYPNPFDVETSIKFRHNLDIPFDATINIYDINGKLVESISETLYNKFADEVKWNGKDVNGVPINSGSYYIQVNLTDKNNKKITKSGILSLKVK
ncbi:MAG: FlgD immunoglobulin-like domain containing protein, partial [Minisyncoccia bacterium]